MKYLIHRLFGFLLAFAIFTGTAVTPAYAALQYSVTHRTNVMTDVVTQAGTTPFLIIYTGTVPTNVGTAATGTLLVAIPGTNPLGTVTSGVLTMNAFTTTAATGTGTAGYYRICTSSAGTTCVLQGTVGTSGADLNLGTTSITVGLNISITSMTITAYGV